MLNSMIEETMTYICRRCGSPGSVKNGMNKCGRPQYHCHACGAYQTLHTKGPSTSQAQDQVLKTCRERASLRGLEHVFPIARQTISRWIRTILWTLPGLGDSLQPTHPEDVLELGKL
jgi:transposase-like protein